VFGAPLAGLAVDHQLPAARGRNAPQGVHARRHHGAGEVERLVGLELRGGVGAGAPHLAVGHDPAEYDPAALRRPAGRLLAHRPDRPAPRRRRRDGLPRARRLHPAGGQRPAAAREARACRRGRPGADRRGRARRRATSSSWVSWSTQSRRPWRPSPRQQAPPCEFEPAS